VGYLLSWIFFIWKIYHNKIISSARIAQIIKYYKLIQFATPVRFLRLAAGYGPVVPNVGYMCPT
jgi:hypothetical protein